MSSEYYIERLTFTGPGIEKSVIEFKDGLNIIHGANDSGKSWILDSIDFMSGSQADKFAIAKDTGCDTVRLDIRTKHGLVSMQRKIGSDDMNVESTDPRIEPGEYKARSSKHWINSVWMTILGIGDDVRLIKNENAGRQKLSIRSILNLICVPLHNINRPESIFYSEGGVYSKTFVKSALLYLLTEDDFRQYREQKGSRKKSAERKIRSQVRNENLEFLSELKQSVQEEEVPPERVKERIDELVQQINGTENKISEATQRRGNLAEQIALLKEHLKSAELMKQRFQILRQQYHSDIRRITFIVDGQQKMDQKETPAHCPFCGSEMKPEKNESYIETAQAELNRILPQLEDVMDAEKDVDREIKSIREQIMRCQDESAELAEKINNGMRPAVEALQKQIEVLQASVDTESQKNIISAIEKHIAEARGPEDDDDNQGAFRAQDNFTEEFITGFNDLLTKILTEVRFDKFSNCYFDFDGDDFDIVVNGKKKRQFGGGYMAFLNASVAVALHQYLSTSGKHSLGTLLLDSPILSLKGNGSEVSAVMKRSFFEYLAAHQDFGQVIIVENDIPKINYKGAMLQEFTHDETRGRYGLLKGYTE